MLRNLPAYSAASVGNAALDDDLTELADTVHERAARPGHLDGGAPDAAGSALPLRKRQQKVPLNTYVRPGTQQRVEVLKDRGYAVTDIVDAALNEFLDRAGVPQSE